MIRTLRITGIIAAIAAGVLLVCAAVCGVRGNPQIEEFLNAPGAIDKFADAKGQRPARDESQVSPLVKQAADFGQYLNPPPPPPPPPPAPGATTAQPEPTPLAPVSPKFDLIATSFYASHPEMSLALIDEPGKGPHWVRQGDSVARLTIEQIGDGAITVRDGKRSFEMTVNVQEPWRKLLKNPPPAFTPEAQTRPVLHSSAYSAEATSAAKAGLAGTSTGTDAGQVAATPPLPSRSPLQRAEKGRRLRPVPGFRPDRISVAGRGQSAAPEPAAVRPVSVQPAKSKVDGPEPARTDSIPPQAGGKPPVASADLPAGQTGTDESRPAMSKNEKAVMIDKLTSDLNSSKVDDEEAARIKQLVEAIKQLDESASTSSVESQPESPNQNKPAANSAEPNTHS